jgi:hypothetical protein
MLKCINIYIPEAVYCGEGAVMRGFFMECPPLEEVRLDFTLDDAQPSETAESVSCESSDGNAIVHVRGLPLFLGTDCCSIGVIVLLMVSEVIAGPVAFR